MFKIPQDLFTVKLHPAKFLEGKDFRILPKGLVVQTEGTAGRHKEDHQSAEAEPGRMRDF